MMKHMIKICAAVLVFVMFLIPGEMALFSENMKHISTHISSDKLETRTIKVALYDCGHNNRFFFDIFEYNWTQNNRSYQFNVTVVDNEDVLGEGEVPLTTENFDLLLIGASAQSYLHYGLDTKWRENIQQFVAHGGGYIGICGGANAASQGFENPKTLFHTQVNKGVLRIADVYIDDDFMGEWQYLLKFGFDAFSWNNNNDSLPYYINVNTSVEKTTDNVIFSIYNGAFRHITYAGGPGMYTAHYPDDKLGDIIPLLVYNEEPMYTKPLHYWRPTLGGWKIWRNVTTELLGTFAGIATTYNSSGRIVLYGPHPEHRVVVNGSVKEYLGHGIPNFFGSIKRYVFNYFGTPLNYSYNWWIIRRSAAWSAKVPDEGLPPVE